MPQQAEMTDDEVQVRRLIERRADALRTKSATETLATQAANYVQYPLNGVLQYAGESAMTKDDFDAVFTAFEGPIGYEMKDLHVTVGDRVAVSNSLSRISAQVAGGPAMSMWFRKTLVFEKNNGSWEIVLEHESVPMTADGSGRAAVDLTP
jgi:PhnB protein